MWKGYQWLRPQTVDDPVFGRLRFVPIRRDPLRSYWEGSGIFAPTGGTIEYFVEADEAGPGDAQRALYRRMEAAWTELAPPLGQELAGNHRLGFGVEPPDVWAVYRLSSVSVPRAERPDMEWELGFESSHEGHLYTVEMRGWQPTPGVRMDG